MTVILQRCLSRLANKYRELSKQTTYKLLDILKKKQLKRLKHIYNIECYNISWSYPIFVLHTISIII